MPIPEDDAQLPLKKRARRRLVGAIALAVLAAVVLPMVMDQAPQAPVRDVQIRIPGQDQVPAFSPKTLAAKTAEAPAAKAAPAPASANEKVADKAVETVADKAAEPAKAEKKTADKPAEKPAPAHDKAKSEDAQRAAAILTGKAEVPAAPKAGASEHVILIGAFANPANVRQLQVKLGELGIKVYTETLDSPQGKKTRVRAGPFASREAADKALEKMKRIGVNGVVAAR